MVTLVNYAIKCYNSGEINNLSILHYMQKNSVVLENITFSYEEEKPILKNVSMVIPQGKITVVMGGSGCGKTTLLRLISGQYKATRGKVEVFGENIARLSNSKLLELRKNLGMLFQFGALFTDINVHDNVAFVLNEHTDLLPSIIDKIVNMKLKSVGLFGCGHMMPQELSGGMARRVALARSTALDPQLMLYDEPFTGLDPISLQVIAMLIQEFSRALNQTVVLVTHDLKTTLEIADNIYFMEQGEIIFSGTPSEIKNTSNEAVRQFIEGNVDGPFKYEFATSLNYTHELGLNKSE